LGRKSALIQLPLLLFLLGTLTHALAMDPPSRQGPVVAQIFFPDQETLNRLARELDIWEVDHEAGRLLALLHPDQQVALLRAGYRMEIDEQRTAMLGRPLRASADQATGIPGYPCYRTVEETYASMAELAHNHPGLASWVDIGDSWDKITPGGPDGYDIYALVLTNENRSAPKAKLFLMAAIHARELTTAELAARFAERLVAGHGSDAEVTWLLDHTEIHVVPVANPDGRKWAEQGYLWRKNTDDDDGCSIYPPPYQYGYHYGADLNRNSSFHWGGASANSCAETYQGPSAASEPETQALQDYVASIFPDQRGSGDDDPASTDSTGIFITLHSYSELVLFPYGFRPTAAPNDAQLETLGRKFGYFNGYTVCQAGEPGCIYATTGASDDWAYGELGLAAYTFELGAAFFQDCASFESEIIPANLPALLYAAKAARRPYRSPAGPESLQVVVTPTTTVAGSPVTLTAVADDGRYDSNGWGSEPVQNVDAARYTVDAASWSAGAITHTMKPADGALDAPVEAVQATVDTTGWAPGRHFIFVESRDSDGNWGVPGAVFLWIDAPEKIYLPMVMQAAD